MLAVLRSTLRLFSPPEARDTLVKLWDWSPILNLLTYGHASATHVASDRQDQPSNSKVTTGDFTHLAGSVDASGDACGATASAQPMSDQHFGNQPTGVGEVEEVRWMALEIISRVLALDDNCKSTIAAQLCQLTTNQRLLCALRWQQDSASLQVERAAFFLPAPQSAASHPATSAAIPAESAALLVAGAAEVVQRDAEDSLTVRVCGVELPVRPLGSAGM